MKKSEIKKYLTNDLKFQEWRFEEAIRRDNKVVAFKARAVIEARKEDLRRLEKLGK